MNKSIIALSSIFSATLLTMSLCSCNKVDKSGWVIPTHEDEAQTPPTEYTNYAAGKFYLFDQKTLDAYSDQYPVDPWASGIKLTDETAGQTIGTQGVAWQAETVNIILDLGSVRNIDKFRIHALNSVTAAVPYPSKVVVSTKVGKDDVFEALTKEITFTATADASWGEIVINGEKPCRYIKFELSTANINKMFMVDEIEAWGSYKEDPKYVPAKGAYHGAFNNSTSFADNDDPSIIVDPEHKSCPISTYEDVVGKQISMFLWYQQMEASRGFAEIQNIRDFHGGVGYGGRYRMLVYGWLPKISSSSQASGALDEYHKQYFKDVAADENKANGPLWFRPANEMNGGWVDWYGDPVNYVKAWRRMYNIAEQYGVTKYNVFVWSPNSFDSPATTKNNMKNYYPGDIYVDWLGASVYPPSKSGSYAESERYPATLLKNVEKVSATKPIMIAEGAYSSDYGQSEAYKADAYKYASDHIRWVTEWFELGSTHPRVKAVIWENHCTESAGDRRIHKDSDALKKYRELVQDSYWLGTLPPEVIYEMAERLND